MDSLSKKFMKIAIIGANGFLGSHFRELSVKKGLSVEIFPRNEDLTQLNTFQPFGHWSIPYDIIIHCAHSDDLIHQIQIDANIVRWWKDFQPTAKLITFGSDACYHNPGVGLSDHSEPYYLKGKYSNWHHFDTKRALVSMLQEVDQPSYHFIISSLFGPNFKNGDIHLVHDLIQKVSKAKKSKAKTIQLGSGGLQRECVYAPDVVKNVMSFVNLKESQPPGLSIYNLGSTKKCHPVQEIAEMICKLYHYPIKNLKFGISGGPYAKWLDSSLAQRKIKYSDTSWEESLSETILYYENQ